MSLWRCRKSLLDFCTHLNSIRYLSNKSAWITKIRRNKYLKMYPTRLVFHDGSTVTIRYFEPRRIIKLPLDITTVSEEEKQIILERRKPKKKVVVEEEVEDNFDHSTYLKLMKKKAAG